MTSERQPNIRVGRAERHGPTVLQVLPALETGGAERGTVEIAAALQAAGWRAIVASAGGSLEYELRRTGAAHWELPLDRKHPLIVARNAEQLARLIRSQGVDLVHARSRAPAWSAYTAARATGRPFVTTVHAVHGEAPWKHWYNAVMARGDVVIAVSDFVAEHLRRHHRRAVPRLVTIPRGIDTAIFNPANVTGQRIVQLADAWRLADGVNVVMLPARFARLKEQELLLRALSLLGRHDVIAVLLGGEAGPDAERHEEEIERLLIRRRYRGQVRIVPTCRDMAAAYMLADVVVAPALRSTGAWNVIVEAQAMGRPVIASSQGVAGDLIRHGETGWLTPPGNPEALASALNEALSLGHAGRERLAEAARAGIEQRFSLAAMQASTLAVYRDLLARWR